jgi:hypothetical protein
MLGLLILGRGIFWLVGFLSDTVFYGVMVFWFGLFLVWGWFQFLGGWFLFRFCWFLSFWMLWAVVFILGRWLVWWFGFCGVFVILQSFAS